MIGCTLDDRRCNAKTLVATLIDHNRGASQIWVAVIDRSILAVGSCGSCRSGRRQPENQVHICMYSYNILQASRCRTMPPRNTYASIM